MSWATAFVCLSSFTPGLKCFGGKINILHFRRTWDLKLLRLSRSFYTLQADFWVVDGLSNHSLTSWYISGDGTLTFCWPQHLSCFHICGFLMGKNLRMAEEILCFWDLLESNPSCPPTCSFRNLGDLFLPVEHPLPIDGFILCPLCPPAIKVSSDVLLPRKYSFFSGVWFI